MNIALLVLSAYLFILPVLFVNSFLDKNDFPRLLFTYSALLLLLTICFIASLLEKKQKVILKFTIPDLLVLLFLLIVTISSVFSVSFSVAYWGNYPGATQSLLFFLSVTVFYFLLRKLLRSLKYLVQILLFCFLGLLFNGVYGLYSYLKPVLETGNLSVRATSLESHPIFFGLLMMVGFFLSLTLVQIRRGSGKYQQILLHVSSLIFITGVIISFSRGVWVSAGFSAFLVFILVCIKHLRFKLNIINPPAISKVFILIGVILIIILRAEISARIGEFKDNSVSASHSVRLLEIRDALKLIKEKSFPFGVGPSHLSFFYPKYRSVLHNQTSEWMNYPERIRNNYLDILASFGPFGLTAFIVFLLVLVSGFIRQLNLPDQYLLPKLFLYCGWIALLVYGLFYFYTLTAWIYFWFLSAALVSFGNFKTICAIALNKIILTAGSIAALLLLVAGLCLIYSAIQAEVTFTKGLVLYNNLSYVKLLNLSQDFEENILFTAYNFPASDKDLLTTSLDFFKQAVTTVPYNNSLYNRQYIHSLALLGRLTGSKDDREKHYLDAYAKASDLIRDNPQDYLNFKLRASIASRLGMDGTEGIKYLMEAIRDTEYLTAVDPANNINFDNLGLLYREAGKFNKARQAFEKSISLKADYLGARLHLAEAVEVLEGKEAAKRVYEKAAEIIKDNKVLMEKLEKLK